MEWSTVRAETGRTEELSVGNEPRAQGRELVEKDWQLDFRLIPPAALLSFLACLWHTQQEGPALLLVAVPKEPSTSPESVHLLSKISGSEASACEKPTSEGQGGSRPIVQNEKRTNWGRRRGGQEQAAQCCPRERVD